VTSAFYTHLYCWYVWQLDPRHTYYEHSFLVVKIGCDIGLDAANQSSDCHSTAHVPTSMTSLIGAFSPMGMAYARSPPRRLELIVTQWPGGYEQLPMSGHIPSVWCWDTIQWLPSSHSVATCSMKKYQRALLTARTAFLSRKEYRRRRHGDTWKGSTLRQEAQQCNSTLKIGPPCLVAYKPDSLHVTIVTWWKPLRRQGDDHT
jgi:hypothetical protein